MKRRTIDRLEPKIKELNSLAKVKDRGEYRLDYIPHFDGNREKGYYLVWRGYDHYVPRDHKLYNYWLYGENIGYAWEYAAEFLDNLIYATRMGEQGFIYTNCQRCGFRFRLYKQQNEPWECHYSFCPKCGEAGYTVRSMEIHVTPQDLPVERACIRCGRDLSQEHWENIRVSSYGWSSQVGRIFTCYCQDCFPYYQTKMKGKDDESEDQSNPHSAINAQSQIQISSTGKYE